MVKALPAGSRTELVLGVPRARLWTGEGWRGIRRSDVESLLAAIRQHGEFRPRDSAEQDPSWKQIIPYVVLRDGTRWFLMRRSRAGGDIRLHERYSVGIGGHVNPGDGDVSGGLRREWAEEVEAGFFPDFQLVGLLNDDTDPVGAVHLGIVYTADAAGRRVTVREVDKLSGAFVERSEVVAVHGQLETWSQLAFDDLDASL